MNGVTARRAPTGNGGRILPPRIAAAALALALFAPAAFADSAGTARRARDQVKEWVQLRKEMPIIRTPAELNCHLEELAKRLQERTLCYFAGPLKGKAQQAMLNSRWNDYCQGFVISHLPDGSVGLRLEYKDSARMLAAYRNPGLAHKLTPREAQALQEAEKRLAEAVSSGMSDAEKARALHDDLILRSGYRREGSGEAAELLLEKSGICEAYSRTLFLMLGMAGIPCHIIAGEAGEPHSWILARIDGEWLHIDATWDDPLTQDGQGILSHKYFMINDRQMAQDHSWQQGQWPVSAARDAVFFRDMGRYFTSYQALWAGAAEAARKGDAEYEAYLTCYGSNDEFFQQLQKASSASPALNSIRRWIGPDLPEGAVLITFDHSGIPPRAADEIMELARETAEGAINRFRQGKAGQMLHDMADQTDTDFFIEEGERVLHGVKAALRRGWQHLKSRF